MNIELIGHYGSDEIIALSAWTSTSRNLSDEKRSRIQQMIERLWMDGHETPFEKGIVHFLVDSDIASHIHLLKHRISSLNAESARYKELKEDRYIIPKDWEGNEVLEYWAKKLNESSVYMNDMYHKCIDEITPIIGRKRAKESARYFKMYNSVISCDVMFNMRSFANFQKLRNSEHAQKEIRDIAAAMWSLVEQIEGNPFEHTMAAIRAKNII